MSPVRNISSYRYGNSDVIIYDLEENDTTLPIRAPVRPRSAYSFYQKHFSEEIKSSGRKLPLATFNKLCSESWKKLSEREKIIFQRKSNEDKERYRREMQNYLMSNEQSKVIPSNVTSRETRQHPRKPKRPLNEFFLFSQEERNKIKKEMPGASVSMIGSELGRRWRSISSGQKVRFQKTAKKQREEYHKKMEKYRSKQVSNGDENNNRNNYN